MRIGGAWRKGDGQSPEKWSDAHLAMAQDWRETGMAFALGYIRGIMP